MTVEEFLDSLPSKGTKKIYKMGLKKFFKWYGKTPDQVLQERKDDLTQRPEEDLVTYKNRAANYTRIIERFHAHLVDEGYKTNTAKSMETLSETQHFFHPAASEPNQTLKLITQLKTFSKSPRNH